MPALQTSSANTPQVISVDSATAAALSDTSSVSNGGGGSMGNTIGHLQELCVHRGLPMPIYDLDSVEGQPHQRSFSIKVKVGSLDATGGGTSKKDAKRDAASKMIAKLQQQKPGESVEVKPSEEQVEDLSKRTAELKIEPLTPEHKGKIQTFYNSLQFQPGSKMHELHRIKLKKDTNCFEFLEEIAKDQKFEVTWVEIEARTEDGEVQVILQLSQLPVAVCYGTGKDINEAKQKASRGALEYLRLMTKRTSGQAQTNGK